MVDLFDVSFIKLVTGTGGESELCSVLATGVTVGHCQAAQLTDITTYVLSAGPISAVGNVTFLWLCGVSSPLCVEH